MLDLKRIKRIKLSNPCNAHSIFSALVLTPNYALRGVKIDLLGLENISGKPSILAMNHTDRFNYWPFQYKLRLQLGQYTATWVKGKYYETALVGMFMEKNNNIPAVSRGYIISKDFSVTMKRRPTDIEYRELRDWVQSVSIGDSQQPGAAIPRQIIDAPRAILGRQFSPETESYAEAVNSLFAAMNAHFIRLNERALELGCHLLIFPQGTRSKRLSKARIGLAQIALHTKRDIIPVGCSGSDQCYPGTSPFAKRGRIVYRVGKPITYDELAEFHVPDFEPFSAHAENTHRSCFQSVADLVMDRINDLVDEPYKFGESNASDGVRGTDLFL